MHLNHNSLLTNVISPNDEMLAFEALWAIEGMTPKKFSRLFDDGKLPSLLLSEKSEFISQQLYENIKFHLNRLDKNFSVAVHSDFQYPESLQDADHPIELFYYKGDINLIDKAKCISIVGARNCSEQGRLRAEKLSSLLVNHGFTIVSGLARGVDTAALTAAIKEGGRVIGVIGTPINEYYPKENKALQDSIAKSHLLISQVPFYRYNNEPFTARKYYFTRRNATMSAISCATIIVEASDTSGTLTQARAAINQGRKLFILNSCFENSDIQWPSKYERKGAIRVKSIEDITSNLTSIKSE